MHATVLRLATCTLRPLVPGDAPSIARHADDRRVSRNLRDRFPFPYAEQDALDFIAFLELDEQQVQFGIEVDGAIVGGVGLGRQDDVERHAAELGYWLGAAYWGRGIMPEAVRAVTEHAHRDLGILRVFAKVYEGNVQSERVLEKAGFRREARLQAAIMKDGRILDAHLFAHVAIPGG